MVGMNASAENELPEDQKPERNPISPVVGKHAASTIPPLGRDSSFWGMTLGQFLGAFNDNVFKQLLLLLAISVASAAVAANPNQESTGDDQWKAMLVFALPFLLFSGFAGYLSDRFSKRPVILISKSAEILVMSMGLMAFYWYDTFGYNGLLAVLFLMGTQSAFFGPSKYGILPEMLHQRDLPRANGIFLMTTFLAIIFGQVAAGFMKEHFESTLWMISLMCVGIAVVGTISTLLIRGKPAAQPDLPLTAGALFITKDMLRALRTDQPLLMALLISSLFWMIAGLAQPSVNSLGLKQLEAGDKDTSILQGAIGVGIMFGCLLAGFLSKSKVSFRLMNLGAWGIVFSLAIRAPWGAEGRHLLGYHFSLPVLIMLGGFTGLFAVPIQVYLQSRPVAEQKGRMIAAMNQANWIGIILSALLYKVLDEMVDFLEFPRSALFACIALLMLPIAILYRPADIELPAED